MVILDTSVIIDHLRSQADKFSLLKAVVKKYVDEVFLFICDFSAGVISREKQWERKSGGTDGNYRAIVSVNAVYI